MVPPAALCIHLCIGQAYAFSVFNLPMTKLIGITKSAPDDWKLTDLGWIFSIAIFFLGASAAVLGRWVEEGGPRRAMFAAALCFSGGFLVSAVGVWLHQLWLVYLGYGALGGTGLGLLGTAEAGWLQLVTHGLVSERRNTGRKTMNR